MSVPILDRIGYSFLFGTGKVKLYQNSLLIIIGVLCGSLYRLELSAFPYVSTTLIVKTSNSSKGLRLNEKFSIFWHKRLGHISKQRMVRLIKDEIILNLDFSYFDTCVDCINAKLTSKIRNAKDDRCIKLLEVIHTDNCGPLTPPDMGGYKYFITFIDDYSRYGFIELIDSCHNRMIRNQQNL